MRSALRDIPPDALRVATGNWFRSRLGMICRVTPYPGKRNELVERLLALAELAASAPGCYLYLIHDAATDPNDVWVVEAWRSRALHDIWLARPEVLTLMEEAGDLIAAASEPILTVPVGGKGLAVRRA